MEFIEDQQADAFQGRVILQAPGEDAFGDHLDAGTRADLAVQADAITHGLADFLSQLAGQALGGGPGGQAPGFEHEDGLSGQPVLVQERQGHAGRLAGTGRGFEHRFMACRQGGTQCRQNFINWQRIHAGSKTEARV